MIADKKDFYTFLGYFDGERRVDASSVFSFFD